MALSIRWKRLFRYSSATLLFAMLCTAGYFGGYRTGFDVGKRGGKEAQLLVKSYPVADLSCRVASSPLQRATPTSRASSTCCKLGSRRSRGYTTGSAPARFSFFPLISA